MKDDIETGFDDVIIDEETKEIVRFLSSAAKSQWSKLQKNPRKRQAHISGMLFYGPPGTGKTNLGRAIAKESRASMLAVDPATLQSQWVGQSEKNIKAAFTLATKLYPCVLFIDEVDALFYRRTSEDHSWERSALTQFLQEMDGLKKTAKAPVVIVATNRPQDLDEAFLRRLPQKISFQLPDARARAAILRIFIQDDDKDPSVNIDDLAAQTQGYSGSDLRSLCDTATMMLDIEKWKAVRDDSSDTAQGQGRLSVAHFTEALRRIRPSVSHQELATIKAFKKRFHIGTDEVCIWPPFHYI